MNTFKKVLLAMVFSASLHAGWDFPNEKILNSGETGNSLDVGIDSSGKAITVWTDINNDLVFASNWNGSAWLATEQLSSGVASERSDLAVSANGEALAVWRDNTGGPGEINARFWNGSMWESEILIAPGDSSSPLVVINSSGIGFSMWKNIDFADRLETRRWNGSTWEGVKTVTTSDSNSQNIAVNASGDAIVTFVNTTNTQVFASIWNDGTSTWVTPVSLVTGTTIFSSGDKRGLGMDDAGNAVTIWSDFSASPPEIQGSFYNKGTDNWTRTSDIKVPGGPVEIVLAVSANGKAIVLFLDSALELKSATLTGLQWSDPITVATSVNFDMEINLVADASGNAVATWKDGPSAQVLASSWNGSEWSDPETLSNIVSPMGLYDNQDSAINASGEAVVIWGVQNDTSFKSKAFAPDDFIETIFGSELFPSTIPLAPSDFAGRVGKNKFLTQTECINFLTWAPSADTSVVGYRVYLGESIVAEVSSEGPFEAVIHNRIKNFPYTYRLVAINASGQESDPLILNLN